MAIIVYLTIYTGALVRHTKSSLAYGAWPIPFDDIVPHNAHDWVQFSHRGMALITFIWIMITFIHDVSPIKPFISIIWLGVKPLYFSAINSGV